MVTPGSIIAAAIGVMAIVTPGTALAQFGNPATTQTPITSQEIGRSYGVMAGYNRQETLRRLNRVCASERRSDRQRCDAAWKKIHAGYAKLQARRVQAQID